MPNATLRGGGRLDTLQVETQRAAVIRDSTVEVGAGATAGTEYVFIRLPTNARIHGQSVVSFDDLASSGSPTLDFGFKGVNGNFTTDDDCVNDGIDVFTAAAQVKLIKDRANYGKTVWELRGLASDPGGFADLIGTIRDAATNTGGTLTVTVMYSTD